MRNLLFSVKWIAMDEWYEVLPYIQNVSTQYIPSTTDIANVTKVELDIELSNGLSATQWLFWRYIQNNAFSVEYAGSSQKLCCDIWSSSNRLAYQWEPTWRHKMIVDVANRTFTVDDTVLWPAGTSWQMASWIYWLVWWYYNGFLWNTSKYYSVKVWENNVVVYDLVPVRRQRDWMIWMFNIVNNTFLVGEGTWEFTTGDDLLNMVEENIVVGYYISTQWQVLENPYNFYYQDYIKVVPWKDITLTWDDQMYFVSISEYWDWQNFIQRTWISTSSWQRSLTITATNNTKYIRWWMNMYRTVDVTMDMVLEHTYSLDSVFKI